MARVVVIVNSDTGALVDVAGNVREGGRYERFAKRMLSTDENPVLDYGGNGGDTLVISANGGNGKEIRLHADKVVVMGDLEVSGKTLDDFVAKSELHAAIASVNHNPSTPEQTTAAFSQLMANLEHLANQG